MKIPLNEVIIDDEYVMSNLRDTVYAVEDFKWVQVSTGSCSTTYVESNS